MSNKRLFPDQDPDYENIVSNDQKRLKVIEKDNKEATVRKIENIIKSQFDREKELKEIELDNIDQRLYQSQAMLDQLRACIIVNYYTSNDQEGGITGPGTSYMNLAALHPAIIRLMERMAKSPFPSSSSSSSLPKDGSLSSVTIAAVTTSESQEILNPTNSQTTGKQTSEEASSSLSSSLLPLRNVQSCEEGARGARFKTKKRVIVGNVSKYIPVDRREDKDQSTHKWMVYVRGPKEEPRIDHFVKKVWFFLHPSYRPNDLVEITHPPFHLTRRGWGEFPVRVQLHFHDPRNKRVDILHTLKLDMTYTGLQTLGAETIVDVLIYKSDVPVGEVGMTEMTAAIRDTGGDLAAEDEEEDGERRIKKEMTVENDVTARMETSEKKDAAVRIKTEPLDTYESLDTDFIDSRSCVKDEVLFGYDDETPESVLPDGNDTLVNNASSSSEKSSIIENDSKFPVPTNVVEPVKSTTNAGNFQIVVVTNKSRATSSSNSLVKKVASSPLLLPNVSDSERNDSNAKTLEGSSSNSIETSTTVGVDSKSSKEEPTKSGAQPTANGVNTFVKCADKHGNLYLIPLSIFLKMDPASQASIIQGATAAQAAAAVTIGVNSINVKSIQTPPNSSSMSSTPAIVPAFRNPTASVTKPMTTPVFAPRIVNNVSTRFPSHSSTVSSASQLRPRNSVSLLSGVTRLKTPVAVAASTSLKTASDGPGGGGVSRNNIIVSKEKSSKVSVQEISLNLDSFDTMERVMKHILRYYPLVQRNPDRVSLPFCASSVDVFLSWNVGKKCAAEWQRSRAVRNKLLQLCSKCDKWKEKDLWSVKRTLLWCRRRGYTPMKPADQSINCDSSSVTERLTTYTEADDLLVRFGRSEDIPSRGREDEEEIDVVTIEKRTSLRKSSNSPLKPTRQTFLPSTPCGEFVTETIEQIGVKVNHEEVVEGVMAPLVEEVLLSATKSFAEDILRLSLENAFERSGGKRCPSMVDVNDVASGVSRLPLCDFLTDRFMGTKMENYHLMDYENVKL